MKIKTSYVLVAFIAMLWSFASATMAEDAADQAVAVVFVQSDSQPIDVLPVEPRPEADSTQGEVLLSDADSHVDSYQVSYEKVPVENISLHAISEQIIKPSVIDNGSCNTDTCLGDSCDTCNGYSCARACQPCRKLWLRADYLLWWTRGSNIPPLVTTSTDQDDNGILGQPTTEILFGGSRENSVARSAPRFTFGYWFDCCQKVGIQLDYFNLGQANNDYSNYSDGSTLLARPFYSVLAQGQAAELIAKDSVVEGHVRVNADDYFNSFGILGRWNICCHQACRPSSCCEEYCDDSCAAEYCGGRNHGSVRHILNNLMKPVKSATYRIDLIGGYRYYKLDDNLSLTENLSTITVPGYPPGTTIDVQDSFRAMNEFHGGELGIVTTAYRGRWSLELLAKMALGNNRQIVAINGSTDIDRPGDDPAHYEGGLLALEGTNIGRYAQDRFVIIPQFGAELGYCLTPRVRVYCGYNFLYWAHVARAAEQIDTNVNTSYIPPQLDTPSGPRVPAFSFQDSDFWAQGLNFGLECHF